MFASVIMTCMAGTGPGAVLLQTGFETAPFRAGLPVAGQDGWLDFWGEGVARVSAIGASGGRQCVAISGGDLAFARPGVVAGTCGKELFFDPVEANRPRVRVACDVKLDGRDTGEGPEADLLSANLFVVNTANQVLGGYFVSSNGTIYAFGRGGQDYMFATPYALGSYARLELDIDAGAGAIGCRVNGATVGILALDPAGTLQTMELWTAALEMASVDGPELPDRAQFRASFDDVFIAALPGPRPR